MAESVSTYEVELGFTCAHLHRVFLKSDLVSGPVTVRIWPTLPVEGVSLLLGNDLAGERLWLTYVYQWSSENETAFQKVKGILTHHPVLVAPDFTKPFKLAVDASGTRAGAVLLLQDDDRRIDHPECYFSSKFTNAQKKYCTTEKELLALILALQYFHIYVAAAGGPIAAFTDHNPLTFLYKLKKPKPHAVEPPFTAVLLEYTAHKGPRQYHCRCLLENWIILFTQETLTTEMCYVIML